MESVKNFYQTIVASSHPLLLCLHLAGKSLPIVFYLIGSWFLNFTAEFILIILLLAADFYFTKNINGRRLIQQRWWYDCSGEESTFRFESYKEYPDIQSAPINPVDLRLFWWSLYVAPTCWAILWLFSLLKFQFINLILVSFAFGLTVWNAYAYRLCDKWEPGHVDSGPLFQLPMLPSFANIDRMTRLQSFFNRS